jgi:hypothetical protein
MYSYYSQLIKRTSITRKRKSYSTWEGGSGLRCARLQTRPTSRLERSSCQNRAGELGGFERQVRIHIPHASFHDPEAFRSDGGKLLSQDRVKSLLRTYKGYQFPSRTETLHYPGEKFGVLTRNTTDMADNEVGKEFLRKIVLMNLGVQKTSSAYFFS